MIKEIERFNELLAAGGTSAAVIFTTHSNVAGIGAGVAVIGLISTFRQIGMDIAHEITSANRPKLSHEGKIEDPAPKV